MSYSHTQRSPLHYLLLLPAAVLVAIGLLQDADPEASILLGVVAGVLILLSFSFQHLTVEDEGDRLRARFGPIPLFQTSVRYEDITDVRAARSSLLDGWGIHWVPGRGWTYNLWGFGCVELRRHGRILRIGTDEPEELAAFVNSRIRR